MGPIIIKATRVLQRQDGSQAKIIASAFFSAAGLHMSVGVDVFRRDSADHSWSLCSDRPHPEWRKMSVDDYARYGRSEQLRTVTPGEILSVTQMIGKPALQ